MIRPALRLSLIILAAITSSPAGAASQEIVDVRLAVDNDNFNFWVPAGERPDHEYTHGARLELDVRTSYAWQRQVLGDDRPCSGKTGEQERCLITTWSFTHQIYTPRTNSERLIRSERPYAGWLSVGMATHSREADRLRSLRLELGITGSPSLAEAAQTLVHSMGEWWMPLGWDHQLSFEPAFLVGYDTRIRERLERGAWSTEAIGGIAANLGTLRTSLEPEVQIRAGHRIRQSWDRDEPSTKGFSATLIAGASGALVLRNLFLDGTLFRTGHSVERIPVIGTYRLGIEVSYGPVSAGLIAHTRSREYVTEAGGHQFSSLTFSVRPGRD
jgi:hypothetical protein